MYHVGLFLTNSHIYNTLNQHLCLYSFLLTIETLFSLDMKASLPHFVRIWTLWMSQMLVLP